jgi:hypothetical protein
MATFHQFLHFPAEIYAQIWEMTVEPRVVEVQIQYRRATTMPHYLCGPFLFSSTPVTAPLQTCREARKGGLYQRAFFALAIQKGAPKDSEQRYVWLNSDLDMVSIGDTHFEYFKSAVCTIKRLRFERDNKNMFWFRSESTELDKFVNAID